MMLARRRHATHTLSRPPTYLYPNVRFLTAHAGDDVRNQQNIMLDRTREALIVYHTKTRSNGKGELTWGKTQIEA